MPRKKKNNMPHKKNTDLFINKDSELADISLGQEIFRLITNVNKKFDKIAIICIGTDRCTGDSYGPLIGLFLKDLVASDMSNVEIYGTIHEPVHAKNLEDTINSISAENTLVIAVDASMGSSNKIGWIKARYGTLKPGAGVNKELPEVGDISVLGIVNFNSGGITHLLLQTTRLSIVYQMAQVTAKAFALAFQLYQTKENMETTEKVII